MALNSRISKDSLGVPVALDGGWGWMVVLGSFFIHVIADGIVFSFGIFYIEFLDYFKRGKGETAWVGSLMPGFTLIVGPLASVLTIKYGSRITVIIGSFIASLGFVLSVFAPNLYYLYFSIGFLSGVGFGLIYFPAIVTVGYYFDKMRSLATGMAVCGSGFGMFIFNPFCHYLIDMFGWRGAILIQAGILLNCIICGVLFRPLNVREPLDSKTVLPHLPNQFESKPSVSFIQKPIESTEMLMDECNRHKHKSVFSTKSQSESVLMMSQPRLGINCATFCTPMQPSQNILLPEIEIKLHSPLKRHSSPNLTSSREPQNLMGQQQEPLAAERPLCGTSFIEDGTNRNILNTTMHQSHVALYMISRISIPSVQEHDTEKLLCCTIKAGVCYTVKKMCDFSLLTDWLFLMFAVSNFLTSIGFNVPFIFLTDRAVDHGISKDDAKWLVSTIGISNTFGRLVFGVIADSKKVNRLMLYSCALTICGVATALCPFCVNFILLLLYACVFGIFIGVYVSLTSVVLIDLLGLKKLANSFGLLLLFQGVATLIGPPMAGWLYDKTGSYDISFFVAGIVIAVSGVMLFFVPVIKNWRKHYIN